jgi:hypothetical protein
MSYFVTNYNIKYTYKFPRVGLFAFFFITMRCCAGERCLFPNLPVEGRHFCAICKKDLHGVCGIFNGDDSAVTFRNRCFVCPATAGSNDDPAIKTPPSQHNVTSGTTQQSAIISAKDVNAKDVTWADVKAGDRPSDKPGQAGQMVKSVSTICGIDGMSFSTDQLRAICSNFKLSGYRSKKKSELLQIIGIGKIHNRLYESSDGAGNSGSDGKAPAKTKNCCFRLLNVLFSDEISPKFLTIGAKKDKNLLDTGLAANDEYFWQEVAEKYQDVNDDYECLAWDDPLFDDIDASVALPHSWSKLREIYKGLSKLYSEAFENHKKSGNHDDFVNFCGNRGEVYYLHLWLQEKPQMESLVLSNLPDDVFFDSGRGSVPSITPRRSPTESESSFNVGARGRTSLAASVGALVEERRKSREQSETVDKSISQLNEQKLQMQISRNLEENVNRLIETKKKLKTETDPGIIKVLRKYEKRLNKLIDMSSSSSSESEAD